MGAEARTHTNQMCDSFIGLATEAAQGVRPQTYLVLEEIKVIMACNQPSKPSQLKTFQFIDKLSLQRARVPIKCAGMVSRGLRLPFLGPFFHDCSLDLLFE